MGSPFSPYNWPLALSPYAATDMPLTLFLRLLSLLPLGVLHALGSALGWCLMRLPNRERRIARDNVARCFPELSDAQRRRLVADVLAETAKTFFETAALWHWSAPRVLKLVKEVDGRGVLDRAVAEGRGVVVVMPHLGSWELASLYCSSLIPMTTLYKAPDSTALEALMLAGRQRCGAHLVATDAKGLRALHQALARKEAVGILPDQTPKPGAGIHAPFFGQPAYTMTLSGRLIQKSESEVVYVFARRLARGRGFRLCFRAAAQPFVGVDLEQATARLNADIESCVREVPAQYQWTYKRFRYAAAAPSRSP